MKVLLLNTYATGGGAAVAARRMLEGLLTAGVDAKMLVASHLPQGADEEISSIRAFRHRVAFLAERLEVFRQVRYDRKYLFRYSSGNYGVDISDHPWVQEADIIHIHWTQHGFLSLQGLQKLLSLPRKKFFWSLHDFWALTGGCHIPYTIVDGETQFCQKFQRHCGECPLLHSKKAMDSSFRHFQKKSNSPLHKIHFLGVSSTVERMAKASPLLQGAEISLLPNFISPDTFYYNECDKSASERRILFVAARIDDPVKGLDLCEKVLKQAAELSWHFEREAHFIAVGELRNKSGLSQMPVRTTHHKRLSFGELRELYQTAHLTLSTSRYETFGQTLLESIACGTPALAFEVGGTSDIIRPGLGNGGLVEPYDIHRMAEELVLLTEPSRRHDRSAVAKSVQHFSSTSVINQLLHLYNL